MKIRVTSPLVRYVGLVESAGEPLWVWTDDPAGATELTKCQADEVIRRCSMAQTFPVWGLEVVR